jgi:MarR family transcriptional regulator, transcriptional regulator for hemolysin
MADLAFLLSQTGHALTTELTAKLASVGITPRGLCVLKNALAEDLTQIRLAERCGLDKTTMVVTLDELERAGLAERRLSRTDRRARIIAVTEAGARLAAEADAVVEDVYADVLHALPEDERDTFVRALERLAGQRLATPVACERPVRRRAPRASAGVVG